MTGGAFGSPRRGLGGGVVLGFLWGGGKLEGWRTKCVVVTMVVGVGGSGRIAMVVVVGGFLQGR